MTRWLPAVLAGLVLAACAGGDPDSSGSSGEVPPSPPAAAGAQATVTRLFDGDSMLVLVDGEEDEVRLIGINAPEGDECHGDEARDALASLVGGGPVTLVAGPEDRDGFGRLLRYLYAGDVLVNAEMVAGGHATVLQGEHPFDSDLAALADEAWDARAGMWAPEACGPATNARILVSGLQSDPPGPDDEVLNDEWIELQNEGDDPVALTGWTLRDESSQNRFRFPAATLAPGAVVRVRTGCGTDGPTDLHWCSERSVWSNGGDTVIVQDRAGNVVARARYTGR